MATRLYTTRRQAIVSALVEELKKINGTGDFLSNVYGNVSPRLLFWDEVQEYPSVHVNAGAESRQYQGGGYKDRFLSLTIRVYVQEDNSVEALEALLEDIETVIENNSKLQYVDKQGQTQYTHQLSIMNINTDEGVLDPLGVGEIICQVMY